MIEQNAKPGAIALDEMLNDIEVPSLDVPELGALLVSDKSKDLFEEKKRKAWKELDVAEARCDFAPNRMRITNRGGVFFITLWKSRCTVVLLPTSKAMMIWSAFRRQHHSAYPLRPRLVSLA